MMGGAEHAADGAFPLHSATPHDATSATPIAGEDGMSEKSSFDSAVHEMTILPVRFFKAKKKLGKRLSTTLPLCRLLKSIWCRFCGCETTQCALHRSREPQVQERAVCLTNGKKGEKKTKTHFVTSSMIEISSACYMTSTAC